MLHGFAAYYICAFAHCLLDPKSVSTEINWKQNMDLTKKVKDGNSARRKRGFEPKNFFSWFVDHVDPSADDIAEVCSSRL